MYTMMNAYGRDSRVMYPPSLDPACFQQRFEYFMIAGPLREPLKGGA
jgi:hypothetical protein